LFPSESLSVHIIVVAWLYVTVLMALTAPSLTAALLTFALYGFIPLAIFVYIFSTPWRRARRTSARRVQQLSDSPDNEDAKADQ
jgi:membrane protein implicated in regulation of membrane protease activity